VAVGGLASGEIAAIGLAVASLVGLSAAPTLAALSAGLTPGRTEIDEARARRGHVVLTGLTTAWSGTAAAGVVVAVAGGSVSAAALAAALGLALVLRVRSHADVVRRAAIGAGGLTGLTAAVVSVTGHVPAAGFSVALLAACTVLVRTGPWRPPESPLLRRGVELAEYAALAAVLPLALWATGAYTALRALSLA
jgi:hypothetical protein